MRVLLDHNVPHRLRAMLPGHEVVTAAFLGWDRLSDGDLIRAAADEFDVVVTLDRSMPLQQMIAHHDVALMVVEARSSRIADIEPLVPRLISTLSMAQPRRVYIVA